MFELNEDNKRQALIASWWPDKLYGGCHYVDLYFDQSDLTQEDIDNGKGTRDGHLITYDVKSNMRHKDTYPGHNIRCSSQVLDMFVESGQVCTTKDGRCAVAFDADVLSTDPKYKNVGLGRYIDLSSVEFKSDGDKRRARSRNVMQKCTIRDQGPRAQFVNRKEHVRIDENRKFGGSKAMGRYPLIGYYDKSTIVHDDNGSALGVMLQLDVDRSVDSDKVRDFGDKHMRDCYCKFDVCKQLADAGSACVLGDRHYISFTGCLYQKGVASEGHGNIILLVPRDPSLAKTEKDEQFISWYNSKNQFGPSVHDSFGKTEISLHNRNKLKQDVGYSAGDFSDVNLNIEVEDDFVKE